MANKSQMGEYYVTFNIYDNNPVQEKTMSVSSPE